MGSTHWEPSFLGLGLVLSTILPAFYYLVQLTLGISNIVPNFLCFLSFFFFEKRRKDAEMGWRQSSIWVFEKVKILVTVEEINIKAVIIIIIII